MKRVSLLFIFLLLQIPGFAQGPKRPRITGIDHVSFYTTAPDGVRKLYGDILGLSAATAVEAGESVRYMVGSQWVGYSSASDPKATDRMDHVAFRTDSIVGLRRYLIENGIKPTQIEGRSDHSLAFSVTDPDGHRVEFVESGKAEVPAAPASAVSHRIIHGGFLVYHREAEDHFYKDILGFRPYWHGGMKDDVTDWVSLQVADGTDWLEYMLNQPEHSDLRLSGIMNHVSFGVADMQKTQELMESHGWKPHGDEEAKVGRDGKWQLNVYDPDLTRVELMEFKPAQKPCCSEFTAEHPSE
jgi:catechol 2,3-dioxygenase-like lactoylglutathione lyase family enzyme